MNVQTDKKITKQIKNINKQTNKKRINKKKAN